jgi:PPM family protein phosphatase
MGEVAIRSIIEVAGASDVGCVRTNNEDSLRFMQEGDDFWALVADGCGGEAAGEVASRIAVDVFASEVARTLPSGRDLPFILRDAFVRANQSIIDEAKNQGLAGMGTTFSAFYIRGKEALTVHAGDSRIYRKRDGVFERLSVDHTWVQEQVKVGRMTEEEAENHPRGGILMRALGANAATAPDIDFLDVRESDAILLSSDGLHRVVTLPEISAHMDLPPDRAVQDLIALALRRGSPDNVSVIALRVKGFEEVAAPPAPATA